MSGYSPANDNGARPARERRGAPRRRALLRGKVVYARSGLSCDCTIRDLSRGGARITLNPEAPAEPPLLILVREGLALRATTAWRTAEQAGLRFHEAIPLDREAPPGLEHVRRLWLELLPR